MAGPGGPSLQLPRPLQQLGEVVVHAPDAEVGLALEKPAKIVNPVLVPLLELDKGKDEIVGLVQASRSWSP